MLYTDMSLTINPEVGFENFSALYLPVWRVDSVMIVKMEETPWLTTPPLRMCHFFTKHVTYK